LTLRPLYPLSTGKAAHAPAEKTMHGPHNRPKIFCFYPTFNPEILAVQPLEHSVRRLSYREGEGEGGEGEGEEEKKKEEEEEKAKAKKKKEEKKDKEKEEEKVKERKKEEKKKEKDEEKKVEEREGGEEVEGEIA